MPKPTPAQFAFDTQNQVPGMETTIMNATTTTAPVFSPAFRAASEVKLTPKAPSQAHITTRSRPFNQAGRSGSVIDFSHNSIGENSLYTNPFLMTVTNKMSKQHQSLAENNRTATERSHFGVASGQPIPNSTSYDNAHKMPLILASKNYNKMKKLHHIRNIYLNKDPPLFVRFERLGNNFD